MQPGDSDTGYARTVFVVLSYCCKIAEAALEFACQSQVYALANWHKASRLLRGRQEFGKIEDPVLINSGVDAKPKPVLSAAQSYLELRRVDGDDANALALGPVNTGQCVETRQCFNNA